MKLNAYILAADPAWIEASVLSYYALVDRIVASFDENGRGWTGAPVDVQQCLRRLRAIDTDRKMTFHVGDYSRPDLTPMENDTRQRQEALDAAGTGAHWVLQIDTDEVLPRPERLLPILREAQNNGVVAVEWPMRVLFRRRADGQFLEICAEGGFDRFEYPGPIAVRPGVRLVDARRTDGPFLRLMIRGDRCSLQLRSLPSAGETREERLDADEAIVHNSWARDAASIKSKVASWSHNQGLKSWLFYYLRWKPAPVIWKYMRDFHPFAAGLWPALKISTSLPAEFSKEVP